MLFNNMVFIKYTVIHIKNLYCLESHLFTNITFILIEIEIHYEIHKHIIIGVIINNWMYSKNILTS